MKIEQAFKKLLSEWEKHPKPFRDKYRSYRSKFLAGKFTEVGENKMREILLAAGKKRIEEKWLD